MVGVRGSSEYQRLSLRSRRNGILGISFSGIGMWSVPAEVAKCRCLPVLRRTAAAPQQSLFRAKNSHHVVHSLVAKSASIS